MGTDYLLYQVNKVWYRLYWAYMLCCALIIVIVYFAAQNVPLVATYAEQLHINGTMAILAGTMVAYSCTVFWWVARRSVALATLCGAMIFAALLFNALAESDPGSGAILYAVAWIFTAFFCGMYGLPYMIGAVFLTYFVVLLHNRFQVVDLSTPSLFLLGSYIILVFVSYFFWKYRYTNTQDQEVNQLSGMLRGSQQQSEILIQSLSDGVIVVNTDGRIGLINPAAAELTGWPVNEAQGIDVQLVMKLSEEGGADLPKENNPFVLILNSKEPTSRTLQLTARDGKKRVISLVLSPVVIPKTTTFVGAVAVIRDISEARAAEKQRAEFISTASHEMRTPVAAIEGYLALALNDKVSTIDTRARSYLDKAHSSTQHLGKLFQDLLTSSKAEDGRLANHPAVVEMGAFLQQLTDDLKFTAEKKGLLAEFIIGSSDAAIDATRHDPAQSHMVKPLYYVHVDPDRMREVLTNLFDNATKYTEQGKISIGLTGDNEVVQMYVRDTGPGIPADDIPHLFQKFYRVDNSATRTIGGTGLGLFICRKIVELYHGRIWAESQLGKGSTFFINLPRLSTKRATEIQANETNNGSQASAPSGSTSSPT